MPLMPLMRQLIFYLFGVHPLELWKIGVVTVLSLFGAAILRVSCWLFNQFAGGPGSPGSVPKPNFGKACVIALITTIVQQVVSFRVALAVGAGEAASYELQATSVTAMPMLISIPIGFIVFAALVSRMLPTTFRRAFGVALCQFLIGAMICVSPWIMIAMFPVSFWGPGP